MDNKPKFKPLVLIQCYEDRQVRQAPSKNEKRPNGSPEAPQEKSLTRHTPELDLAPPPPPPPPPFDDDSGLIAPPKAKTKIAPPVPSKYSTLSYMKDYPQPPPCPPPDYDTISINSTFSKETRIDATSHTNDAVEMESLESFRLNNPSSQRPKPPNTYFKSTLTSQLSNSSISSSASGKKQRPVSVTIGEYPSGSLRRQPGKLDFLHNGTNGEMDRTSNGSINTQFASELAHTLSRSNLKKKTEPMENILNSQQIQQSNGSVTISLNNCNKVSENNFKLADNKSNRVTINICSLEKKPDVPNGILKNGNGNHNFHNSNHKTLVQQKSITFGEM